MPEPQRLTLLLKAHPARKNSPFVFPSPRGNRELHMLDKCKEIARRAKLDPERFHLCKFRSTYATVLDKWMQIESEPIVNGKFEEFAIV